MNLILTLRAEFICLMVLVLLLWYASIHGAYDNIKKYKMLNILAIGHVAFEIITVITVNNFGKIPSSVNHVCHELFYMFVILYCFVLQDLVIGIIFDEEKCRKSRLVREIFTAVCIIVMVFLPIEYVQGDDTNYSHGPGVVMAFASSAALFLVSLALIIYHSDRLSGHDRRILIPSFLLILIAIVAQIAVPELLFTGADLTLLTAAVFIGIIDPVGKFRHKAYYDLMTGLRNHNCYVDDMSDLRKELGKNAYERNLIYVSCDINGLKQVNDDLGHAAGDDYIRTASRALKDSLAGSYAVYRTGGDEFCAIFLDTPTEKVKAEVARLRKAFGTRRAYVTNKQGTSVKYSFSIGYVAAMRGEDIMDTAKRADAAMMEEKRRYYRENGIERRRPAAV